MKYGISLFGGIMSVKEQKLGELLLRSQIVTGAQLEAARNEQRKTGGGFRGN